MDEAQQTRSPETVVHIAAGPGYDVRIGNGLLDTCGSRLAELVKPCHALIVCDDTVAQLWLTDTRSSLEHAGFKVSVFTFAHGEASKNMRTLSDVLEYAAVQHLTRSDVIVALGGGVTGDLAGFAAACYLRGIRFMQVPTTLLAAVDASVGGKTAVDLSAGKNLAGAFHQPIAVICDTDTMSTLPASEFAFGVAEGYKSAVLADAELFDLIEEDAHGNVREIIARCVDIKRRYVEADEREAGARRYLNLGHTFGHAVEICSGFEVGHGAAVAVGMVMAARYAAYEGCASPQLVTRFAEAFVKYGLPCSTDIPVDDLTRAALSDKKRLGDSIIFVLPRSIGECYLKRVPVSQLREVFEIGMGVVS